MVCKYFLPFCRLPLHFNCFYCCAEAFSFDVIPLTDFCSCCLCFWCHIQKNHCQDQCQGALSVFLSSSFIVSGLTFKSLIHFTLIFVEWYKMSIQFHSCACGYPVSPTPFIEDTILSLEHSWLPCQILVDHICEGLFLASQFCSIGLCVCFFMPYHTILITVAL